MKKKIYFLKINKHVWTHQISMSTKRRLEIGSHSRIGTDVHLEIFSYDSITSPLIWWFFWVFSTFVRGKWQNLLIFSNSSKGFLQVILHFRIDYINVESDKHLLETMHFQLISTNEASLEVGKPAANFCSLVTLKTWPYSGWLITLPLQANSFF